MNEFDLGAIWLRLVRGWKTPVAMAAVAALLGLHSLMGAKPVYSVHMLIMPAPTEQSAASVPGGALSTLLGFAGGSSETSNYVRYQNLLFSNAVAQRMQDRYGMLQYVFASDWDAKNHRWIERHTLRGDITAPLLRLANIPVWSPPDITALAQFLRSSLIVLPSTTNDIIDVSMNDNNVAYAIHIMLTANEEANTVLRDQVARRARQQVDYLQRKLAQTTVEDYRQTLLALLSSEEKTLMLTQTDASFAAEIISPPMASPRPVAPRPVLTLFVAILVGAIVGSGIVVFFGPDWWQTLWARLQPMLRRRLGNKIVAARR
jgi:uncharacterized protein involved in exopolysaccharide biosynthesis